MHTCISRTKCYGYIRQFTCINFLFGKIFTKFDFARDLNLSAEVEETIHDFIHRNKHRLVKSQTVQRYFNMVVHNPQRSIFPKITLYTLRQFQKSTVFKISTAQQKDTSILFLKLTLPQNHYMN